MVGILGLLLAIPGVCVGWWVWRLRGVKAAKTWPRTEATIESAAPEVVESNFQGMPVKLFAFSYKVNGEYYSGRFALMPYISDPPGENLCPRMRGRNWKSATIPSDPKSGLFQRN